MAAPAVSVEDDAVVIPVHCAQDQKALQTTKLDP